MTLHPRTPVIVEALRTPLGRRNGALADLKGVELLSHVMEGVLAAQSLDSCEVDQVIGGCVTQIGEQSLNVTRNAWLNSGYDPSVGCSTVDVSCGSGQQANHLMHALIASGSVDVGIACGVESMTRVPIGSNLDAVPGHYKTRSYPWDDPPHTQFGGAERIAARECLTRRELDEYGIRSQELAAQAWSEGRFDREVLPFVDGPHLERDEGIREVDRSAIAELQPTIPGGMHTPASTSQVSDGAAAVLWMSLERAMARGSTPRATLEGATVTGADPYYLLDGPVAATSKVLARTGTDLRSIDLYEVNEAFASVVLTWQRRFGAEPDRVNVNGGAISLGHPLGATGTRMIVSALHELERRDRESALTTMCCGGSLGTAAIVRRL